MRIFSVAFVVASIIVMSACTDSTQGPTNTGGGKNWFGSLLTISGIDDVLLSIDTTDVKCGILLKQTYSELYDWDSSYAVPPFTNHSAHALYHPDIDSNVTLAPISINGTSLGTTGMVFGHGSNGFQSNFTSSSSSVSIYKPSSDAVLGTRSDTSLTFQPRVRFNGLAVGDTVDLSAGKTLNFIGHGASMHVELLVSSPTDPNDGKQQGFAKFFDGAASVSLSSTDLNNVSPGKGELKVTKFEPIVVSTSNGKKIVVFAHTEHTVSVVIVP